MVERQRYGFAEEGCFGGHSLREVSGVVDGRKIDLEERSDYVVHLPPALAVQRDLPTFAQPPQTRGLADLSLDVPSKLQVIGQYQVRKSVPVAQDLLAFGGAIHVDSNIFALEVSQGDAVAILDDEVGRAAGYLRGFVEGNYRAPAK